MPMNLHNTSALRPAFSLSVMLGAAWLLAACSPAGLPPPTPSVRPVLVATVKQAPLGGLPFAGEVRARERAELAFAVPGVVREVLVDVGASVRRGQLLARIDAAPQQAQLASSEADGRRLQALLAEAQRREKRLQAARDSGAATDAEWTAVQAEVQSAGEAVAAAQAQRAAAAWNHAQTELRAPFEGRVALRQLEVGQAVGAGTVVIGLEGRGREMWLAVPGSLPLAAGQTLALTGSSGSATSRVLQVSPRVEAGGSRRVLMSAPDAWATGEAVSVQLWPRDPAAVALLVPLRAVQMDAAHPAQGQVLRLPANGQVPEHVPVTLGALQGEQVEVRSGLKAGDQVVLAGGLALAAGQAVTPVSRLR
ncbi:efflux RND transporter periplasmic adaptor subunit [Pelomonas aquatica]|jgi:RND family efflux transporter MFP subunit|uniref:Efflux RND transporter periplasmic adaptor subunit n=1 Tax=Pelomonas aquatica TaxID=431058 RepID=A0A9X4LKG0_9BURK|nr:efflux RND transporter periplasmic adaptor subunit [Pelomonas aquatica]